jgi:hypothetical protein
MLAYWLAIAGATHVVLRMIAKEPDEGAEVRPPSETDFEPAVTAAAARGTEPSVEPAATAPAAPEHEPDFEPALAPTSPSAHVPEHVAAFTLAPPPPVVRAEPGVAEEPRPPREAEPSPRRLAVEEPSVKREPVRDEGALPSCEAAAASANQMMDLGAARGAPDLTREAFASVLENGAYLAHCAVPARTALEICAAVQDGKVVGVSVTSEPRDPAVNACVRRAVVALGFPRSERLDLTRTRFAPAR